MPTTSTASLPLSASPPPADLPGRAAWLDAWEAAYRREVRRLLDAMVALAWATFEDTAPALTAGIGDAEQAALAAWREGVGPLTALEADVYESGALAAWIGTNGRPSVPDPDLWTPVVNRSAADYLRGATNRLVAVGDTTWEGVRARLTAGLLAGRTREDMKRDIEQYAGFNEFRADMIARTEVVGAFNTGHLDGAEALGEYGPTLKAWVATGDGRTRVSHANADGQTVALREPFTVGGARLRHPGDFTGPPDEVIQCRCTVVFYWPGDVLPDGSTVPGVEPEPVEPPAPPKVTRQPTVRAVNKRPASTDEALRKVPKDGSVVVFRSGVPGRASLADMDAAVGYRLPDGTAVLREIDSSSARLMLRDEATRATTLARHAPGGDQHDRLWDLIEANSVHAPGKAPVRELVLSAKPNPDDAHWARVYNRPGFRSSATGGRGRVTVYNGDLPSGETWRHEMGHNVEEAINRNRTIPLRASDDWRAAMAHDAKVSGDLVTGASREGVPWLDVDFEHGHHRLTPGNVSGLTTYGQAAPAEDIAEAFRLWSYDLLNGKVGYRMVGGETLPVRFADLFPARAAYFDRHFTAGRLKPGLEKGKASTRSALAKRPKPTGFAIVGRRAW